MLTLEEDVKEAESGVTYNQEDANQFIEKSLKDFELSKNRKFEILTRLWRII